MFEDWKQAWRQAVDNFHRELTGGEAGAAPRVKAMERELMSASGALLRLDEELGRVRREADDELSARSVCERRERLARAAGDEETVRVAAGFAARHAERAAVLQRKIAVLEDERALLARDLAQMRQAVSEVPAAPEPPAAPRRTAGLEEHGDHEFSRLEQDARERAAGERLEELKRKMRG
ncbi:MAG: hypothetical protein WEF86_14695 [Gemmatimonadota bacterium]